MSELSALAAELKAAGPAMAAPLVRAFRDGGRDLERAWRRTARRTAGAHGKHYPSSITSEVTAYGLGAQVDVGPERGRLQGSMGRGFEFGSENQRPHLDGWRHLPKVTESIERAATRAVDSKVPGLDR